MIDSIVVSIVNDKCGILTDKNNYRPIALSHHYPTADGQAETDRY